MLSKFFTFSALALLTTAPTPISSTRLYVSSYAGTITTFNLTKTGNTAYQLNKLDTNTGCSPNASWLQIDVKHRNLFCLDEGLITGNGSLTSFKINNDTQHDSLSLTTQKKGSLTPVKHTIIPNAPVNSAIFNSPIAAGGSQLLAVAHYANALTTYKVDPITASYTHLQSFNFTQSKPGPNPGRQAAPHPHQVLVDPTGKYLVIPDLGADLIRIFYIDPITLLVSPRPSIPVTPGSGPRHGVFYSINQRLGIQANKNPIDFYLVTELSSMLMGFRVFYKPKNGGMGLQQFSSVKAWGNSNNTIFEGNAPAEILVAPGTIRDQGGKVGVQILVSNRNATFFKGIANPDPGNKTRIDSDTLAGFEIPKFRSGFGEGGIKFLGLSPAGGDFPRSMAINKKGDLLAVGLQNSGRVVVFERDGKTGALGKVLAEAEGLGGATGVVWDE